ncbi:MAG: DUF1499 domain-containing protein [Gammaproteobacteria bacterium]|nr:DUF1499 domain-containing protein [Gammaproteobacteria bacterium]
MSSVSANERGGKPSALSVCPDSPNCVSTAAQADDTEHYIAPLVFSASAEEAWKTVKRAVLVLPRCKIVSENEFYLKAECRSFLFRFVDDLELQLYPDEKQIAVRSASRIGRTDFGVNRKRVELLREKLR